MKILLDTNFIINAIREKVDLFEFREGNLTWIIPNKVLEELEKISNSKKKKVKDRNIATLAIEIINSKSNEKIDFINFKIENVDDSIVDYCKKNPSTVLATLDKDLKKRVENKLMILKKGKVMEII